LVRRLLLADSLDKLTHQLTDALIGIIPGLFQERQDGTGCKPEPIQSPGSLNPDCGFLILQQAGQHLNYSGRGNSQFPKDNRAIGPIAAIRV
jgi:hypothetical protein